VSVRTLINAHGDKTMSLEHSPARQNQRACFTVAEFCDSHRISRSKLYELWRHGAGPRWKNVGAKRIITGEAAADWRAQDESAASDVTEG
jgi:hypothetical protein